MQRGRLLAMEREAHQPLRLDYDATARSSRLAAGMIAAAWTALVLFFPLIAYAWATGFGVRWSEYATFAAPAAGLVLGFAARAVTSDERPRRRGVIVVRCCGIALLALAFAMTFRLRWEPDRRAACRKLLHQIDVAILYYRNDNRGSRFPPSLDVLISGGYI